MYAKWNEEHNDNKKWRVLQVEELNAFIGLLLLAGVVRSGKESVNELWKMEDCGRPIFRATMGSAGLTMWQMWQMPRASGLRGASGSRENFFQPVSRQVI